ncbi:alpha/beta fold hydrolase [Bosea sp. NBC_00550]|uniref:alpha/beta fold hydrolase n=1 Tax=Bosea sp. NBC_00550 TaxID=2969621 RepID=UPI00223128F0|nr:alpha/beta hydrolase [Bosea sp. NBC_00550]UZF94637.1 alpha/beta hydrolase [Bosea sp. NBC_00550]
MHVTVNGVRLYVDTEGAGLVPDGPRMRETPTLVLLHGGPGADHSLYKPAFSALRDICQIVYYDHRGCGRSEDGPRDLWTLAQWGDDVKALCDALGINKPIVLGTSFGGFVAQAYATRHPGHAAKLILVSAAAKVDFQQIYAAFERFGGAEAAAAARAYWSAPSDATRAAYREVCVPLYAPRNQRHDGLWVARAIMRNETGVHFNGPRNEHGRFDFRDALARVSCPVLVMAGDKDPITPIAFSEQIAASLPPEQVRFQRFTDCGHGILADDRDGALQAIRDFILA